jgi:hypothetical protein
MCDIAAEGLAVMSSTAFRSAYIFSTLIARTLS